MAGLGKIFLKNFLGLGVLLFPSLLQAMEITPFYTQNQSPLVQIFGLPSIGNYTVLPPKKADVRLILDYASNYVDDSNPRESILLDGESARITLDARFGIDRRFEAGVAIPYLIESGGFLDSFIIDYHNTFGFPQGGRDQAPRNGLLYRYQKDGQQLLKINQSSQGIGDIQFMGGFQLYESPIKPSPAVALRASLKLPTGDSGQLHGSGSTDLALWITAGDDYEVAIGHFTVFGAAGIMGMTNGNVLPAQQRNAVGFGSLGAGWSPLRWLAFKVQANGHTSFYKDSALRELNANSVQLTIGGTLAFTERISLDLGVTEDVIVKTAPDVVFHLALRGRL
jgi:hypothetical protein